MSGLVEIDSLVLLFSPPEGHDEASIERLNEAFEEVWAKGKRYGCVSVAMTGHVTDAKGRRLVGAWGSRPRVREMSRRYAVSACTVVTSRIDRGAITALLWIWKPPSPHKVVATAEEGIEHVLDNLVAAEVIPASDVADIRRRALAEIEARR